MGHSRKPTYGTATRLARIIHGLHHRPHGWTFDAIQDELGISERTLLRYLAACRQELVDELAAPLLQAVRRGPRRVLRLADHTPAQDSSAYELLFLYLALTVLNFLDGTVIKDGVSSLWERLQRTLPQAQRIRLADFSRKFYSVPYAIKEYRDFDGILDTIIQCLVYQYRMRIDYRGILGEGNVHEIDPYTLTTYRGGLYLIGHSHHYRKIIWLAVERIRAAEKLGTRFAYPAQYSPAKHTEGTFGIIDGPPARVELLLLTPQTTAYLKARRLHPTQRFRKGRAGTTHLTMTVRGTEELKNWILSMGPYVKVVRPKSLRDAVATSLARASRLYRAPHHTAIMGTDLFSAGRRQTATAGPRGRSPIRKRNQ